MSCLKIYCQNIYIFKVPDTCYKKKRHDLSMHKTERMKKKMLWTLKSN